MVRLVRDNLKVMTLSIGDGANDVSMLQVAEVSVARGNHLFILRKELGAACCDLLKYIRRFMQWYCIVQVSKNEAGFYNFSTAFLSLEVHDLVIVAASFSCCCTL